MITVSVVSHNQGPMVEELLRGLARSPDISRVVLTINVPEQEPVFPSILTDRIIIIHNKTPKGFGANHNSAFIYCETPFFCVLNPDVRFYVNPFKALLNCFSDRISFSEGVSLCAPAVISPTGVIEDSVRHFPSVSGLLKKLAGLADGRYKFALNDPPFYAEWVAGMFMLFKAADYEAVGGFDERYFLYYEDVDICARLWRSGRKILFCPEVTVVHAAQRASHRNLRYLSWHLRSMLRFFAQYWGRLPRSVPHS